MKTSMCISLISILVFASACGREDSTTTEGAADSAQAPSAADETNDAGGSEMASKESKEIVPGLSRRILKEGGGATAQMGQTAVVHYTGWLYDENAANHRGEKFDSSVDRGQHFEFNLGAGNVIRGWEQGVVGMQVGEIRELTIAPELAYGERGYPGAIPPSATLVFEVELADVKPGN